MNSVIEQIVKRITKEIATAPYVDKVLLDFVKQGYWTEITIDYCPSKTVINLNHIPHAIVYHGRILEKDLYSYGVDFNTIEYVKPRIEYLNLSQEIKND